MKKSGNNPQLRASGSISTETGVHLTPAQSDFCRANIRGFDPHTWQVSIAGKAGSERSFLRVARPGDPTTSYILVLWDSNDHDWERFIAVHDEVSRCMEILPRIYAADPLHGLILEEDCGTRTLKEVCASNPPAETVYKLYTSVIDRLVGWQNMDLSRIPAIGARRMDLDMYLWETEYFATHCVREFLGLECLLDSAWERERRLLAEAAAALPVCCLHRDFQSENIIVHGDSIKFVDYQGARLGAAEYDLASLLCDPYVTVIDPSMQERLFGYYRAHSDKPVSEHSFRIAAMQRLMQACGAYGNLSLHKGKISYRACMPVALEKLVRILSPVREFPALSGLIRACAEKVGSC
jgi:hypothetical protein